MHKTLLTTICLTVAAFAQIPNRVLVGYWENWSSLTLAQIHPAYNVIQLAFATTRQGSNCILEFQLPSSYPKSVFLTDIQNLHQQGKPVILSIGGASDPVILANDSDQDLFVSSLDSILKAYNNSFDGIDIDFETTSLAFGTWSMSEPATGQLRIIEAIKEVMDLYRSRTDKKLLLTMAPENVYIQGGLSNWQINNANGGSYLPILVALKDSIDLLHPQYYNAGGAGAGIVANDTKVYYDTGDPDFLVAMTATLIEGFTLLNGKGIFTGFPASKVAIGLPSNGCNAAGTGYVKPDSINLALKYLRGEISKPSHFEYTLTQHYPELRGLMTWSINDDAESCNGAWNFAENAKESIIPLATRSVRSNAKASLRYRPYDLLGRFNR